GHISHFGLLEMSRQRIRSSVLESSTEKCPHCGGTGHVRSVSSVALQLLRSLDEMLLKGATHNLTVRTRSEIALYLLNHKRAHLRALEERFRIVIMVNADATVEGQISFVIEKGEQVHSVEQAKALALQPATAVPAPVDDEEDEDDFEADDVTESEESVAAAPQADGEPEGETDQDQAQDQGPDGGQGRKRRRRRRGRRGGEGREVAHAERDNGAFATEHDADFAPQPGENDLSHAGEGHEAGNGAGGPETPGESGGEAERRRRRRGRRGGRGNRRGPGGGGGTGTAPRTAGRTAQSSWPRGRGCGGGRRQRRAAGIRACGPGCRRWHRRRGGSAGHARAGRRTSPRPGSAERSAFAERIGSRNATRTNPHAGCADRSVS